MWSHNPERDYPRCCKRCSRSFLRQLHLVVGSPYRKYSGPACPVQWIEQLALSGSSLLWQDDSAVAALCHLCSCPCMCHPLRSKGTPHCTLATSVSTWWVHPFAHTPASFAYTPVAFCIPVLLLLPSAWPSQLIMSSCCPLSQLYASF